MAALHHAGVLSKGLRLVLRLQVFALHPLYLSLPALAPINMPADIARSIDEARRELDGQAVDYERTLDLKLTIAHRIFKNIGQSELKVTQDGFESRFRAMNLSA